MLISESASISNKVGLSSTTGFPIWAGNSSLGKVSESSRGVAGMGQGDTPIVAKNKRGTPVTAEDLDRSLYEERGQKSCNYRALSVFYRAFNACNYQASPMRLCRLRQGPPMI
jgi:hypothetical protein